MAAPTPAVALVALVALVVALVAVVEAPAVVEATQAWEVTEVEVVTKLVAVMWIVGEKAWRPRRLWLPEVTRVEAGRAVLRVTLRPAASRQDVSRQDASRQEPVFCSQWGCLLVWAPLMPQLLPAPPRRASARRPAHGRRWPAAP